MVLDPMLEDHSEPYLELRRLIAEKKIPLHRATEGQQLNLKGGVHLEVLNPPDPRLVGPGRGRITTPLSCASPTVPSA